MTSPEFLEVGPKLIEDESVFIDLAGSTLFLTEESTIIDR